MYLGKVNGFESRSWFSGQFFGGSRWAGEAATYGQHEGMQVAFQLTLYFATLVCVSS